MPNQIENEVTAEEVKIPTEITIQQNPQQEDDIVVVASTPQQMQKAQSDLVTHFEHKLAKLHEGLTEAQESLRIAKERKWKRGPFERQTEKIENDIKFYEKVKAALEAGYVIIPNIPDLDIFAIRTVRRKPKENITTGGPTWVGLPLQQVTSKSTVGEGRYVNADTLNVSWSQETTKPGDSQKSYKRMAKAVEFDLVDFPFRLTKPQILDGTAEAMKHLIFDDIGITPNRKIRRGDPMIIGRIHGQKKGYNQKIVSFLITWFVNTKDI